MQREFFFAPTPVPLVAHAEHELAAERVSRACSRMINIRILFLDTLLPFIYLVHHDEDIVYLKIHKIKTTERRRAPLFIRRRI